MLGDGGEGEAEIELLNGRIFDKALRRGSIGVAESYMAGDFESRDLGNVFRFFLDNKAALANAGGGFFRVRTGDKLWHRLRANTRRGSRRNIAAHYDLGNAFYAPWLDPSMTYSSAIYDQPNQTLEAAQASKIARIVRALELRPGMQVLEIGCGWGALSEAIARAGATVVAVTVSQEQLDYARSRMRSADLADRVRVDFCDYRDIEGQFDRVVSVEMIEAVGEAHWPVFFRTLAGRLRPGGFAVLQAITIAEQNFAAYRAKADFIQRYIFPGGMLPTERLMREHAAGAGLGFEGLENFGRSYALTLAAWRTRFEAAWPALREAGFDERFRRMWIYYLTYCEVGFERGATDVGLYRFARR